MAKNLPGADKRQTPTHVVETAVLKSNLEASQEREVALRGELQHRVRNILAIVRSIFVRTVAAGGPLDELTDHFCGRLDVIARYQSPRTAMPGAELDFEHIVRDELHGFQFGDDPRISIDGPEASLKHDVAQLIGLAIHELVTNSLKFGVLAPGETRGRLEIRWTAADDHLIFQWLETGTSILAAAPLRRGFGREFIEQALPYQMGAKSIFELRPGGIRCEIVMPIGTINLRPPTTLMDPES